VKKLTAQQTEGMPATIRSRISPFSFATVKIQENIIMAVD
jgi:hypothetical protein